MAPRKSLRIHRLPRHNDHCYGSQVRTQVATRVGETERICSNSQLESDVNVIHNIQEYRLQDNYTLIRKFCTLEKSAPLLLQSLNNNNFI